MLITYGIIEIDVKLQGFSILRGHQDRRRGKVLLQTLESQLGIVGPLDMAGLPDRAA
jgi:hypothetical protein